MDRERLRPIGRARQAAVARQAIIPCITYKGTSRKEVSLTIKVREIVMPRELIEPLEDNERYVRRGKKGKFN
jgi:hypothetical protein